MKILVRNLERTVTEAELLTLFQQYGTLEVPSGESTTT